MDKSFLTSAMNGGSECNNTNGRIQTGSSINDATPDLTSTPTTTNNGFLEPQDATITASPKNKSGIIKLGENIRDVANLYKNYNSERSELDANM